MKKSIKISGDGFISKGEYDVVKIMGDASSIGDVYAREVKMYKQEPEKWKGHVGDISTVLRVSLTGRQNTPDLYEIMQVLGEESIKRRIQKITEK